MNGVDSLVIIEKEIYNDYEFFAHSIGPSEHHGTAFFNGKMCHKGDSMDISLLIQKTDELTLRTFFRFSGRNYTKFRYKDVDSLAVERINGIVYKDIAFIDNVDLEWARIIRPCNIKNMYWSKSKGLIQYEYLSTDSTQGSIYTYYKKLPYKQKK